MVGVDLYRFCRLFCIMTDLRGLLVPRERSAPGGICRLAVSTTFASRQAALSTSCALAADDSAVCIIKSKLDRELLLVPSVAVVIVNQLQECKGIAFTVVLGLKNNTRSTKDDNDNTILF